MGFDFTLVDVFTNRPFGGNQLAVFPDAEGIPDGTMQKVAREFNFSETTFVLPPRDPSHTCRVRIFTPHRELPFAGHPTVGTAAVLASLQAGDIAWSPRLYVFAGDHRDGTHLHARFFAPAVGVDEDPATGSACASLIASLAQRSPERDGTYHIQIDQGVAMGRSSALEGTAYKEHGQLTEVVVSGQATIIGNDTITLPAGVGGPNPSTVPANGWTLRG